MRNKPFIQKTIATLTLVLSVATVFLAVKFVSAWTGPTQPPPDGNISALLSGSGTVNYIPKWTSPTALGNSLIFDNGTNVGIGTTSPQSKLHINDPGTTYNGEVGAISVRLGSNEVKRLYIGWDNALDTNGAAYLQSVQSGVAYRSLLFNPSGGNVGIGTTSPSALLDVADIYSAGGRNLEIGDDVFLTDVDAANTLGIYGQQNSAIATLHLGSGGASISGCGSNIGIGTPSPGTKLTVSGGIDSALATANSGYIISGNPSGQHITIDDNEIMSKATGTTGATLYVQNDGGTTTFGGPINIGRSVPTASCSVAAGATTACTASCAAGYTVTGGGFYSTGATTFAVDSYPSTTTTWKVDYRNPGGSSITVTVYAVCYQLI